MALNQVVLFGGLAVGRCQPHQHLDLPQDDVGDGEHSAAAALGLRWLSRIGFCPQVRYPLRRRERALSCLTTTRA